MNINTGNIPTRKLFKTKIFFISIFSLGVFTSFFSPLFMSKCSNGPEPIIDPEPFEANEIPKDWLAHNEDYTVVSGLVDLTQDYSKYDTLRIPETVTSITDKSFENVFASDKITSITKIIIGGKLRTIGSDAFTGWDTLESIHTHESNTSFSVSTIKNGDSIVGQFLMEPTGLTNLFKTEGLAWGSLQFTAANMAPGNTTIGSKCFSKAKAVTSLEFSNITEIQDYAFSDLPKLTKLDLKTVSKIGNNCFSNDSNITLLSGQYKTTPTIGSSVFSGWTDEGVVDNTLGTLSSESLCNTFLGKSLPDKWTYTGGWVPYSLLDVEGQMINGFKPNVDISKYTSLKIYDGIATVAKDAFATSLSSTLTPNITSLFLGADVSSVNTVTGSKSFSSWDNLSKIVVSPSNTTYKVITMADNVGELLVPTIGLQIIHMTSIVAHGNIVIDSTITKSNQINVPLGGCAAITGVEIGEGIKTLACTIQDNDNIKSILVGPSVTSLESNFSIKNLKNLDTLIFNSFPTSANSISLSGCDTLRSIKWNTGTDITPTWSSNMFKDISGEGIMFYENKDIVSKDLSDKFTAAGLPASWKVYSGYIAGPKEITNTPYYGNGNGYTFESNLTNPAGVWGFETDVSAKSVNIDSSDTSCYVVTEGQYTTIGAFTIRISFKVDFPTATGSASTKIFYDISVKTLEVPSTFKGILFAYDSDTDQYLINGATPTDELKQMKSIVCPDYYNDGIHGLKKIHAAKEWIVENQIGWSGYTELESMKFGRYMTDRLNASPNYDGGNSNLFMSTKIKDIYIPSGIISYCDTFYSAPQIIYSSIPNDWSKKFYRLWLFNRDNTNLTPSDIPADVYSISTMMGFVTYCFINKTAITFGDETNGSSLAYIPAAIMNTPVLTTLTCYASVPPQFIYNNPNFVLKDSPQGVFSATRAPVLANIYVPDASVEAYKNAIGWSNAAERIKPISAKP